MVKGRQERLAPAEAEARGTNREFEGKAENILTPSSFLSQPEDSQVFGPEGSSHSRKRSKQSARRQLLNHASLPSTTSGAASVGSDQRRPSSSTRPRWMGFGRDRTWMDPLRVEAGSLKDDGSIREDGWQLLAPSRISRHTRREIPSLSARKRLHYRRRIQETLRLCQNLGLQGPNVLKE